MATVNPFKPTAGKIPPVLVGRQAVLDDYIEGLENGAGAQEDSFWFLVNAATEKPSCSQSSDVPHALADGKSSLKRLPPGCASVLWRLCPLSA